MPKHIQALSPSHADKRDILAHLILSLEKQNRTKNTSQKTQMEPTTSPSSVHTVTGLRSMQPTSHANGTTTQGSHANNTSNASNGSAESEHHIKKHQGMSTLTPSPASSSSSPLSESSSTSAAFVKELESISARSRSAVSTLPQPTSISAATAAYQEPNRCYICFGTDEDSDGRWVKPCQCTLISHEDCLLDWIDKNRQQFARKQVSSEKPKEQSTGPSCVLSKHLGKRQADTSLNLYHVCDFEHL